MYWATMQAFFYSIFPKRNSCQMWTGASSVGLAVSDWVTKGGRSRLSYKSFSFPVLCFRCCLKKWKIGEKCSIFCLLYKLWRIKVKWKNVPYETVSTLCTQKRKEKKNLSNVLVVNCKMIRMETCSSPFVVHVRILLELPF